MTLKQVLKNGKGGLKWGKRHCKNSRNVVEC